MDPNLSTLELSARSQIDDLKKEFASEWKRGSEPSLETFVSRLQDSRGAVLELVKLDLEFRWQSEKTDFAVETLYESPAIGGRSDTAAVDTIVTPVVESIPSGDPYVTYDQRSKPDDIATLDEITAKGLSRGNEKPPEIDRSKRWLATPTKAVRSLPRQLLRRSEKVGHWRTMPSEFPN